MNECDFELDKDIISNLDFDLDEYILNFDKKN